MIQDTRNKIQDTKHNGFTLIELVIAIGIFIIVISVVLSLFMTGLRGQRKVFVLQNVQDNARFLMSFMAKEIRMSNINWAYSDRLNITRPDLTDVIYIFDSTEKQIEREDDPDVGPMPINSDEVLVTGMFDSSGIGTGGQQARITIVLKVEATGERAEEEAEIIIQTTVSPRNLEL